MSNPIFIDVSRIGQQATDDALEFLYKSTHDHDGGIWHPHESPLLRRMIELFTKRGLDRLEHVKNQIIAWESGTLHKPSAVVPPAPGMMERWTPDELSLVRIYLEALPPADWTLDDHMMAVEWVIQRYLPADELRTEADWLATKSTMMGRVQANMDGKVSAKQADVLLAALPSAAHTATVKFNLMGSFRKVLEYGKARAAENVRAITESVRHQLRTVIVQHLYDVDFGATPSTLQAKLFDKFATLNRDWRRIAVTEAGECQLQGLVASMKPGTKLKRVEQYANACQFCQRINGVVATVVAADAPEKDPDKQIWVGKTNVGRSASPRKRVGDTLVARTPDEMWWLPAGTAHPHCRGRWIALPDAEPGDDPDFQEWLDKTLLS
jgi:hypothetical protein